MARIEGPFHIDIVNVARLTLNEETILTGGGLGVDGVRATYYVTNVSGLGQASIRNPQDVKPFDDGALLHDFWLGARHIGFEGIFDLTDLFDLPCEIRTIAWEYMELALQQHLDMTLRTPDAQLSCLFDDPLYYTYFPIHSEIPLDVKPTDNYVMRQFAFGLVAGEANPIIQTLE